MQQQWLNGNKNTFESFTILYSGFCTCKQPCQLLSCLLCHFGRLFCTNAEFAQLQISWSLLLPSTDLCVPELFFVSAADFVCFDYFLCVSNWLRQRHEGWFPDVWLKAYLCTSSAADNFDLLISRLNLLHCIKSYNSKNKYLHEK